jgi:hypothetical protein
VGTESNFPLPKFVTLGGDCIDGNISGRFDNADGGIGFTLDISEPDESEDVFVADGVGERGEVGVEDGTGVADGLGNCPAPQPEIYMPRTKMETIAIHAFVFIFVFSHSASRAAQLLIIRTLCILQSHCILYLKWENFLRFICTFKKASIITNKSVNWPAVIPAYELIHMNRFSTIFPPARLKDDYIEGVRRLEVNIGGINN